MAWEVRDCQSGNGRQAVHQRGRRENSLISVMAEKTFDELRRELQQTLVKLKAATEAERRRLYLREMSRLLA
jgi:hypothetical protein